MCFIVVGCKYIARVYPRQFRLTAHPIAVGLVLAGIAFFTTVEMFYVVPMIFDPDGLMYKLTWLLAIFIVYNILGNMLACHRTSSSVANLPKDRQIPAPEEEHLWHHCDYCQMLVPPRSWHCKLCNCCILRRDHHCVFTATCIGHNNYRYFFWFTVYLIIGTGLAMASHMLLFVINEDMRRMYLLFHFLNLNGQFFQSGFDHLSIVLNLIFVLNVYAFIFPLMMLAYQLPTLYLNTTFYTRRDGRYDLGIRENFKSLMGKRGLWTFFSPTIKSPLLQDGTKWEQKLSTVCNCYMSKNVI
ncbi:probable palmitoyltransferase ZDHHC24 [Drosophila elegans]|uniref:probable palmitoyltransferase ZDHHC24 n=1 Tax=Drosophila elegans TaxID=30023 RepID=UPI0007E79BD2|nr:probable palmitoyltransferase ZDHHC24 [Drosophila elegans]